MKATKNEKLLDKFEDAVNDVYHDQEMESADPNRESSYYSKKKLTKIRNKILKIMESKP